MPQRIVKKAWPQWFQLVWAGQKTYEYRLADFVINPGDILVMQEWDPETQQYTGRVLEATVGHIGQVEAIRWDRPDDRSLYPHYILSLLDVQKVADGAERPTS
jgi:hypothetical protein